LEPPLPDTRCPDVAEGPAAVVALVPLLLEPESAIA
jgi:hypothetical protein